MSAKITSMLQSSRGGEERATFSWGQIEGIWSPHFRVGKKAWFVVLKTGAKLPVNNFTENSSCGLVGGWSGPGDRQARQCSPTVK